MACASPAAKRSSEYLQPPASPPTPESAAAEAREVVRIVSGGCDGDDPLGADSDGTRYADVVKGVHAKLRALVHGIPSSA